VLPTVLLVFGLCGSFSASAQTDEERAGARAAATDGAKAFVDGDYPKAIEMFTRAEGVVHSPTHLLFIARSYSKLGQLVKAREAYLKITREAVPAGAPEAFKRAKSDATEELTSLEPRIPYVSVVVQGAGPDPITVNMDDIQIPPTLVGIPRPLDPGEHRFQAFAPGLESNATTITLKEGARETVVLTLQPAAEAKPAAGATPGAAAPAEQPAESPGDAGISTADIDAGANIPMWVSFGVGAVGLGLGTLFLVQSSSKRSDADALCGSGTCPASERAEIEDLDSSADTLGTLGVVGLGVGVVGVGAGLYFLLTQDASPAAATSRARQRAIQPWFDGNQAGVFGRF